ncbi:MAG: PDZ domain-containing protein [Proteobacteria bacterium]|nr:PDZ domain-containing protein [Pseudomonadota bacterium]MCP4921516.1 PDZ domain-containing protein [Pseudomonadota bacterium]
MRTTLEKLVSAGFTSGVFVLLFGLAARVQTSEASVTIAEMGAEGREAVFLPAVPQGEPEGESAPEAPEAPEAPVDQVAGPASSPSSTPAPRLAPTIERVVASGYGGPRQRVSRKSTAKVSEPTASTKKKKGRECVEPTGLIEDKGGGEYGVSKDLVDTYANDLGAASTLAWASWHEDDAGETDGFRVRRIRCGSPLHEAGFRNGDVVHSVNGKEITTIPDAMFAYQKVKRRDSLKVAITRKDGSRQKLRYELF